jgi:hypothetical protein
MTRNSKADDKPPDLKYRQVKIDGLDKTRRGKHYDLVLGIFQQLKTLPPGSAMEIPLADVGGIGLANLRSAVHRSSTSHGLEIETLADEKNFYVWRKKVEKEERNK